MMLPGEIPSPPHSRLFISAAGLSGGGDGAGIGVAFGVGLDWGIELALNTGVAEPADVALSDSGASSRVVRFLGFKMGDYAINALLYVSDPAELCSFAGLETRTTLQYEPVAIWKMGD